MLGDVAPDRMAVCGTTSSVIRLDSLAVINTLRSAGETVSLMPLRRLRGSMSLVRAGATPVGLWGLGSLGRQRSQCCRSLVGSPIEPSVDLEQLKAEDLVGGESRPVTVRVRIVVALLIDGLRDFDQVRL